MTDDVRAKIAELRRLAATVNLPWQSVAMTHRGCPGTGLAGVVGSARPRTDQNRCAYDTTEYSSVAERIFETDAAYIAAAANLAPLLAAEVERLELENHKLHGECGHLQADAAEMADRLRAALEGRS